MRSWFRMLMRRVADVWSPRLLNCGDGTRHGVGVSNAEGLVAVTDTFGRHAVTAARHALEQPDVSVFQTRHRPPAVTSALALPAEGSG